MSRLAVARTLVLLVVAWTTFTIGGVYPWTYIPALLGCGLALAAAVAARRRDLTTAELTAALALVMVAAAMVLQLVPLSASTLTQISPETHAALRALDVEYAHAVVNAPQTARHAISLDPAATRRAIAFVLGLTALWAAASMVMAVEGSTPIINGLTAIAVVLAVHGIVQQALSDRPYGFWVSEQGGRAFGPFVNRNHFAGWMLLALPTIIGGLCAATIRRADRIPATWRGRLMWLGAPRAGKLLTLATALAVVAVALVLTYSKAAVAGAAWISVVLAVLALRGGASRGRALAAGVALVGLLGLVSWAGTARIGGRFAALPQSQLAGRIGAWADAWRVAGRFPLAGTGVNTYGTVMLLYQEYDREFHYSAAHNDYLQLLAEGGAVVALPAAAAVVALGAAAWRRLRESRGHRTEWWRRAGALIGVTALAWQELVDFSAQIPAVAMLLAVVLAITTHASARARADEQTRIPA